MNEIGKAINTALTSSAPLTALLSAPTAIHHLRVPDDGTFPCIVFSKHVSTPKRTYRERIDQDVWLVKAIDKGDTALVEDIAAAIDTALDKVALTVAGRNLLVCWRQSDVDYPEDQGDVLYRHVGGLYRIETQP